MGCDSPAVFQLKAADQRHLRRHQQPLCQGIWHKLPHSKIKSQFLQTLELPGIQGDFPSWTIPDQYAALTKQYDEKKRIHIQIWLEKHYVKPNVSFLQDSSGPLATDVHWKLKEEKRLHSTSKTYFSTRLPSPLTTQKNILTSTPLPERMVKFTMIELKPKQILHQEVRLSLQTKIPHYHFTFKRNKDERHYLLVVVSVALLLYHF